jgi:hypothetical protein
MDAVALPFQPFDQGFDVGGFAGAIRAFKGDKHDLSDGWGHSNALPLRIIHEKS